MGLNEPVSASGPVSVSGTGGAIPGGTMPGGTEAAPPRPPRPPLPPPAPPTAKPKPQPPAPCPSRLACHTCTYFNCSGNILGSDAAANAKMFPEQLKYVQV